MTTVLSMALSTSVDGCLWTGVALCCALAARGRSSAFLGRMAVGGAALLGALALVTPTPFP